MKQLKNIPEVLSPAGSLECLKAAVSAGADAVYFGGQAFNARRGAANFSVDQIREAVEFCHLRGVKTNFTLNTMIKEQEFPMLEEYLDQILPLGLGALIIQDLGVASLVAEKMKDRYPDIALHGSTQMAVEDLDGVRFLSSLGFSRVVLARELSLEEIRHICSETDTEIEVFVHGALCYGDSGRCLLSSFHGGRSGNRGACAQPCRLIYEADGKMGCYMNLKDRFAGAYLRELAEAGVCSLKIEGRMKGEAYVAGVTAYYRNQLDRLAGEEGAVKCRGLDPSKDDLKQLFNRGDFTQGYFEDKKDMIWQGSAKNQGLTVGKVTYARDHSIKIKSEKELHAGDEMEIPDLKHPGKPYSIRLQEGMIHKNRREASFRLAGNIREGQSVRRIVDPVLNEEIRQKASEVPRIIVDMEFRGEEGIPMTLKLRAEDGSTALVKGEVPEKAEKAPTDRSQVEKQLRKVGTEFECRLVKVDLSEGVFIPVAFLNALRRAGMESLKVRMLKDKSDKDSARRLREKQRLLFEGENPCLTKANPSGLTFQIALETIDQWNVIRNGDLSNVSHVIFSMEGMADLSLSERKDLVDQVSEQGENITPAVRLPRVGRDLHETWILREMENWQSAGIRTFEANRMGQIRKIREKGAAVMAGPELGVMNKRAAAFMRRNCQAFCVSRELSLKEMRELVLEDGATATIYGHIPYMISEQCVYKERYGCHGSSEGHVTDLKDRQGEVMKAVSHCRLCYSEIFSEKPVYAEDFMKAFGDLPCGGAALRVEFTLEDDLDTMKTWEEIRRGSGLTVSHGGGHFAKGVE